MLSRLQRLETLQYIAAPYATFTPVIETADFRWEAGASSEYRFKLFGIIPFGVHTIRIERFDQNGIQSREPNRHVPVWDHLIIHEHGEHLPGDPEHIGPEAEVGGGADHRDDHGNQEGGGDIDQWALADP